MAAREISLRLAARPRVGRSCATAADTFIFTINLIHYGENPSWLLPNKRPPLASLDAKLDAVAGALKAALPELEIAIKDAIKASEHQRHALLHRIHRAAHDFVVIAAEARVSR